jgi:DNA-binding transcriptional MerR regulator
LSLYEDKNRSNKEVKKLTIEKINEIDQKLNELTLLRKKLSHLADNCKGNGRPDCPILDELSKLQKKS